MKAASLDQPLFHSEESRDRLSFIYCSCSDVTLKLDSDTKPKEPRALGLRETLQLGSVSLVRPLEVVRPVESHLHQSLTQWTLMILKNAQSPFQGTSERGATYGKASLYSDWFLTFTFM